MPSARRALFIAWRLSRFSLQGNTVQNVIRDRPQRAVYSPRANQNRLVRNLGIVTRNSYHVPPKAPSLPVVAHLGSRLRRTGKLETPKTNTKKRLDPGLRNPKPQAFAKGSMANLTPLHLPNYTRQNTKSILKRFRVFECVCLRFVNWGLKQQVYLILRVHELNIPASPCTRHVPRYRRPHGPKAAPVLRTP